MSPETVGDVFLTLSMIPSVASVVVFARVRWWTTPLGLHVMGYMSVIAAVLVLGFIRIFIGDHPIFEVVRVGVFAFVPVVVWWRLIVLVLAQRKGPRFNHVDDPGRDLVNPPPK